MNSIAYIGIGSNQGEKIKNCLRGVKEISLHQKNTLLAQSSLYQTEPWGNISSEWFINGAAKIATSLSPRDLLNLLQEVENRLGKKRETLWGPRPIDLDLLFYNLEIIDEPDLKVPHPLIHLRRFVLVPLNEISPEFIHPRLKKSISELLKGVEDQKEVRKISLEEGENLCV